jgi:molybdenum cofactor cytidylyltransferase
METKASHDTKRIGVLLAAGRGRRMGRTKQVLPVETPEGQRPLVAAAFDSIAAVCLSMVVVLGHEQAAVLSALGDRKFQRVTSDPDAEMFASTRAGLEATRQIDPQADVLLHPGDHPAVERKTLNSLIRVGSNHPHCAIMPVYRGKGGHPVLIPARLVDSICSYHGAGGLRQFWTENPATCLRLVVSDSQVVKDLDTPDDYEASQ